MKPCTRTWQAEALEDGRLDEDDVSSFERHAAGCAECEAELSSLRALRSEMLSVDVPRLSDLQRHAQRQEVLRRANGLTTRAPARRTWAIAATVAAAAAAGIAFGWPRMAPPPSRFEVVDVTHARWHAETDGATSRVNLSGGTALFQVEKLKPEARFLVQLPDGEIEVRGTRFVVDVPRDQRVDAHVRIEDDSTMGRDFPGDRSGRYDLRVRVRAAASPVGR